MFYRDKPTLYLVRGVSGSGKSTFSRGLVNTFGAIHVEADMYFVKDGEYIFRPELLNAAHKWCQGVADAALTVGRSVVVSNTSTTEKEVQVYQDIANNCNANFVSLIIENRNGTMSVHDVPEEVLERQRQRFSVKL